MNSDSSNASDWSVRTNIQEDDKFYGDRAYTIGTLPSAYAGSDWVRTANDSKAYTGTTLVTFTVTRDANVYVVYDDRVDFPGWLSSWTDTTANLIDSEPVNFSIFRKFYSANSWVSLGSNGDSSGCCGYSIIVIASGRSNPTPVPTATPTSTATPTPGGQTEYQAEDAYYYRGVVESEHVGYVNNINKTGSYVEWTVNSVFGGLVSVAIRYGNKTTANRAMEIKVNGQVAISAAPLNGTGSWTSWNTKTHSLNLSSGTNIIRATATTSNGGPNIDKLEILP